MDDYKEIATIEQAVWGIWQFVRENKDSLDSERCTAKIRALVDQATADTQEALKVSQASLREFREALNAQPIKAGGVIPGMATNCRSSRGV